MGLGGCRVHNRRTYRARVDRPIGTQDTAAQSGPGVAFQPTQQFKQNPPSMTTAPTISLESGNTQLTPASPTWGDATLQQATI